MFFETFNNQPYSAKISCMETDLNTVSYSYKKCANLRLGQIQI